MWPIKVRTQAIRDQFVLDESRHNLMVLSELPEMSKASGGCLLSITAGELLEWQAKKLEGFGHIEDDEHEEEDWDEDGG